MVEGVTVKFRWFRTIETEANTVSLVSVDGKWEDAVQLHWNQMNLLYESGPTHMSCGRHEVAIVVDNQLHDCDGFTVVATTFEVNIYLIGDGSDGLMSRPTSRNLLNRSVLLSDDVALSPDSHRHFIRRDETGSSKSPIYEYALAVKDREIADLKYQLGQLKSALIACDVGRPTATDPDGSDVVDEARVTGEAGDEDSIEYEINEHSRLGGDDPAEVEQLVRSLRKELRLYCRKNKELNEEVLTLRAANTRLSSEYTLERSRTCSVDVCCYSDPESSSTQYRELPMVRSFASLPAMLGSTVQAKNDVGSRGRRTRHRIIRRPTTIIARPDSPLSCSDCGSLCTDELLSYGTPPLSVGSAGVQTDITAVAEKPVRLKSSRSDQARRRLFSDGQTKSRGGSGRTKTTSKIDRMQKSHVRERDDSNSDDTDDLLLEADRFVTTVFGTRDLEPVVGKSCRSSNVLESGRSTSSVYAGAKERLRPFIPKSASDLRLGHVVRYLGPTGLVTQGKVAFVGSLTDKEGVFVGIELDEFGESRGQHSSYSPNTTYVPFKKVIFCL